jgi:hypothetical protein
VVTEKIFCEELVGGYEFQGSPSFVLVSKLKTLKEDLKIWNKEAFGDVRIKILNMQNELWLLESKENQGLFTEEDKSYRLNVQTDFEKTMLQEEIPWRQKSRVQWL